MADIQKNMIRALNEQKYLRNLQNEFKPKMIFKNQSEKKARQPIILLNSIDDVDSSAQTIDGSIFSNDISPFSSYLPFSANSNMSNESSVSSTDKDSKDLDNLLKNVNNVDDIFNRYLKHKKKLKTSAETSAELNIDTDTDTDTDNDTVIINTDNIEPNTADDVKSTSLKLMTLLNIGSPRFKSLLTSIDLLKNPKTNDVKNDKNNAIKRIFVKSPDYTSGEDTESSSSFSSNNSTSSASSVEDEQIKIREIKKRRVFIKLNMINGKKSELVPLKISFFGGSNPGSTPMTYDECKKVIQSATEENINVNLTKFLNKSLNTGAETKKPCETEIAKIKEQLKQITENTDEITKLKAQIAQIAQIKEDSNAKNEDKQKIENSNDMGLTQILNASLTGTPSNDMGLTQILNESLTGSSSNDMGLEKSLNTTMNGTPINNNLTDSSNTSATDDQKYIIEITFDNETLEPKDIVINRKEKFDKDITKMSDENKPSNYLFSVNQFIMEQIKTKNRGYILEGETTMACYCSDKRKLDFDTPVFSF